MKPAAYIRLIVTAVPLFVLSGCAGLAAQHERHHRSGGATPPTQQRMTGSGMDCGMHEQMMAANPEQRRAMMTEHMKNMPPEMMKQCMDMMGMQMQMMREHMDKR